MNYIFPRFPEGRTKAVTLSYDDGHHHDIRLAETINRYGLKCTFNLMGSRVEKERFLSHAFIREELLGKGHEIANHGYLHRAQNKIRPIEGIRDVLDCRIALEKAFGIIVRGMAYPDSPVNRFTDPDTYERIRGNLTDLGIDYARTFGGDNDAFALPTDWYHWVPTAHHDNPEIMDYIDRFMTLDVSAQYIANRHPRLFYLWGHSFEFEHKQNWDHLEEICRKLGGRSDIWYATNIEICDYVRAYDALRYNAEGTAVYNPTCHTVWLDAAGVPYTVRPGETVRLGT
ncbi:MAG: polysaccharide deacetylase family protein [Clostridia bacterium]|nr:polysaccharide deacetylase family protein [Clostridia bacterium]